MTDATRSRLVRFAWLSIAAAITTMAIKLVAWWVTDSVGLLSDALESSVNLVAAIGATVALSVAARPADEDHEFGHTKAEYFTSLAEGLMILVAAATIIRVPVDPLLNPAPAHRRLDHRRGARGRLSGRAHLQYTRSRQHARVKATSANRVETTQPNPVRESPLRPQARVAPKEQPPRKLSGTRDRAGEALWKVAGAPAHRR